VTPALAKATAHLDIDNPPSPETPTSMTTRRPTALSLPNAQG
jgi:hypothetical protein